MTARPPMLRTIRGACRILGIDPDEVDSLTVADVIRQPETVTRIMLSIEQHPEVSADQVDILKKTLNRARIKIVSWLESSPSSIFARQMSEWVSLRKVN